MEKAYSTLSVKAINNEKRILKGLASTVTPDRSNDIVEPSGMMFELPMPFLWQHDHSAPIGNVISAKRLSTGLEIEVQIANITEAGTLKDQVDHAWTAIRENLVRGLSIGFRPLDYDIRAGGGVLYKAIEIFEISAVTIACNSQATITEIKRAAQVTDRPTQGAVKLSGGGVKLSQAVTVVKLGQSTPHSIADELNHHEKLLAARIAYLNTHMRKSAISDFEREYGADRAQKVLLMADSLRGNL